MLKSAVTLKEIRIHSRYHTVDEKKIEVPTYM